MSEDLRALIRPIARLQLLMWSTIFVPVIVYGVMLYVLKTQDVKIDAELPPVALYALGAVGGLSVVFGIALHVFFSSEKRVGACLESVPADEELARGLQNRQVMPEKLALIRKLSRAEKGLFNFARRSWTFFMLSTGTVHTSAVAGFIVAVMADRPLIYIPFAVLTAVPTLFMYPRTLRRIEDYIALQPLRPDDRGAGMQS